MRTKIGILMMVFGTMLAAYFGQDELFMAALSLLVALLGVAIALLGKDQPKI